MEKAPLKRNKNIVKLSQDHHASLLFCWKLRQGIKRHAEVSRMINYVKYFRDHHLSVHFKEEEEILFKPLNDEMVNKAIADHADIKSLIDGLSVSAPAEQKARLTLLADTVDDHVRYEERTLFPYLEKALSADQLKNIGEQISGAPLKDNYEDEFWIKSKSL